MTPLLGYIQKTKLKVYTLRDRSLAVGRHLSGQLLTAESWQYAVFQWLRFESEASLDDSQRWSLVSRPLVRQNCWPQFASCLDGFKANNREVSNMNAKRKQTEFWTGGDTVNYHNHTNGEKALYSIVRLKKKQPNCVRGTHTVTRRNKLAPIDRSRAPSVDWAVTPVIDIRQSLFC